MAYSQPRNILRWISRIFIAGILSIIMGTIFWNIPQTDFSFLNGDRYRTPINIKIVPNELQISLVFRLGFYYSTMIIGALPLILQIALSDTHGDDRDAIESDIADNLYGRIVYIVTSVS